MMRFPRVLVLLCVPLTFGCSNPETHGNRESGGEHAREGHDRDGGEHGRGGEEEGVELPLGATYDKVRNGARLVLAYEAATNAFVGTVENTTTATLEAVRVEVHLSNGVELGPTAPADLAPGEKRPVRLQAESTGFERWTAHPEVGRGEHGHDGEEHGEHRRGEHR